jgi:glutamate racemase
MDKPKIGIFDSGLGGLITTHALMQEMPEYQFVYLGDTARLPYGNRTEDEIYQFVTEALRFLFSRQCLLVIIACNTVSAEALHKVQTEFLPEHYPDRKVIGVLVPTAEVAVDMSSTHSIGVLATPSTVASKAFTREIHKLMPSAQVVEVAAPQLVPMLESHTLEGLDSALEGYLKEFSASSIDCLILGCTHYPLIKQKVRDMLKGINVVSQDEILADKLKDYLARHREIADALSKDATDVFYLTSLDTHTHTHAKELFGEDITFELCSLEDVA